MNAKSVLKKIIPPLLLVWFTPVYSEWYQVEVVVFDYLSPDFDGELWYDPPGLPERRNSVELVTELAQLKDEVPAPKVAYPQHIELAKVQADLVPYLKLDTDVLGLEFVQRMLLLSSDYRPQLHLAWQQPGFDSLQAKAVHLHKFGKMEETQNEEGLNDDVLDLDVLFSQMIIGEDKFGEMEETQNEEGLNDDVLDLDALFSQTIIREDLYKLFNLIFEGTIKLRSSKFLHVDVDMAYFPEYFSRQSEMLEEDNDDIIEKRADYVRLKESRKIKLNEIHYFDHPLFGIILRVSRVKQN